MSSVWLAEAFNKALNVIQADIIADGNISAVVVWWDLQMTEKGDIVISTAPSWIKASLLKCNLASKFSSPALSLANLSGPQFYHQQMRVICQF